MATIILPLLLILAAIGGILVVVARRLPEIRNALRAPRDTPAADTQSVTLTPRGQTLEHPPILTRQRRVIEFLQRSLGALLPAAGALVKIAASVTKKMYRALSVMFHRLPASVRIPQPGIRHTTARTAGRPPAVALGDSTQRAGPPAPSPRPAAGPQTGPAATRVPTTADITPSEGSVLQYPQSLPETTSGPREETGKDAPDVPAQPAPEVTVTLTDTEVLKETSAQESADVVASEPPVILEKTRERRTRGQRRVVGRVRPRHLVKDTPMPTEATHAPKESTPPANAAHTAADETRHAAKILAETLQRPSAWSSTEQTIPALIGEENYGRAESLLIDILSKNPRDTEAYRLLGTVYLKRGEFAQAKEVFEEALRREAEHPGLHGPLGDAYIALGEYAKALSMYQRAHDEDETNIGYLEKLLTISSRMDHPPLVKVTARKILALNPDHAEAKKLLATVNAR